MKRKIKVIVHEAEEGDFWVEVPATPGAVLVLQLDLDDLPRRLTLAMISASGSARPCSSARLAKS